MAAVALLGFAVLLLGDGGGSRHGATARPASGVMADGPPGPSLAAAPTEAQAVGVITAFARGYINWDPGDLARRLTGLAAASVGQARSEMALAAVQSRTDTTIVQGGISNRGTVEAVAPRSGHPGQYLVVTRETTLASASTAYQGLAPAWHLTVATVVPARGGGWVVSEWQPES
jgi:hypothetical protein